MTTIAWRLAHIIVSCLGYRVAWYFGGPEVDFRAFAYAGTAELIRPAGKPVSQRAAGSAR